MVGGAHPVSLLFVLLLLTVVPAPASAAGPGARVPAGGWHPFDPVLGGGTLPPHTTAPAQLRPINIPRGGGVLSCGKVRVRGEVYEVFRLRGRVSCARARATMATYLSSRRRGLAPEPKALPGGWRCSRTSSGEDRCLKGATNPHYAREWIDSD